MEKGVSLQIRGLWEQAGDLMKLDVKEQYLIHPPFTLWA